MVSVVEEGLIGSAVIVVTVAETVVGCNMGTVVDAVVGIVVGVI